MQSTIEANVIIELAGWLTDMNVVDGFTAGMSFKVTICASLAHTIYTLDAGQFKEQN